MALYNEIDINSLENKYKAPDIKQRSFGRFLSGLQQGVTTGIKKTGSKILELSQTPEGRRLLSGIITGGAAALGASPTVTAEMSKGATRAYERDLTTQNQQLLQKQKIMKDLFNQQMKTAEENKKLKKQEQKDIRTLQVQGYSQKKPAQMPQELGSLYKVNLPVGEGDQTFFNEKQYKEDLEEASQTKKMEDFQAKTFGTIVKNIDKLLVFDEKTKKYALSDLGKAVSADGVLESAVEGAKRKSGLDPRSKSAMTSLKAVQGAKAFEELQAMRAASPTGGALGGVNERELDLLIAAGSALQAGMLSDDMLLKLIELREDLNEGIRKSQNSVGSIIRKKYKIDDTDEATMTDGLQVPSVGNDVSTPQTQPLDDPLGIF
jgi:hypothetical protein